MTRDELLALPTTTSMTTVAQALGIGKDSAYELYHAGAFPVPVLQLGNRLRVPTAPLLRLLGIDPNSEGTAGIDPSDSGAGPASPATATAPSPMEGPDGHQSYTGRRRLHA